MESKFYKGSTYLVPRFGQAFAKWEGSPQTKHLPEIGSPVADMNVTLCSLPPPLPPPRPPLLLVFDADLLTLPRGAVPPPFMLSSQLHYRKVVIWSNVLKLISSSIWPGIREHIKSTGTKNWMLPKYLCGKRELQGAPDRHVWIDIWESTFYVIKNMCIEDCTNKT